MKTRTAIILSVGLFVIAVVVGSILAANLPSQKRAMKLGQGMGTLVGICICVIWGIWYFRRKNRS